MPFINEKQGLSADNWRTVNYERDAILQSHGSTHGTVVHGRGSGEKFTLTWKGEAISFQADSISSIGDNPQKPDFRWVIVQLAIPSSFKANIAEIRQLISDGLTEWGFIYDRSRVNKVEVDFTYIDSKQAN